MLKRKFYPSRSIGQRLMLQNRILSHCHWSWVAVLLTTLFFSLPCLELGFYRDDFAFFGRIAASNSYLDFIFLSQLEHVLPLRHAFFLMEFFLFGNNPFGYYCVSIVLHLGAVLLIMRWSSLLFSQPAISAISGLIFGIGARHFYNLYWITIQGQLLCAVLLLAAFIQLEHWIKTQSVWRITGCYLSFQASMLAFSVGPEILLLVPIYIIIRLRQEEKQVSPGVILKPIAFISFAFLIMLSIRYFAQPQDGVLMLNLLSQLFANPFGFLLRLALAVCIRPLASLSGAVAFSPLLSRRLYEMVIALMTFAVVTCLLDWKRLRKEKMFGMLFFLLLAALMFYAFPVLSRLEHQKWFVGSRARYAYFPMMFMSIGFSYLMFSFRAGRAKFFGVMFAVFVIAANGFMANVVLRRVVEKQTRASQVFLRLKDDISKLSGESMPVLRNDTIWFARYSSGDWGVSLYQVCALYYNPVYCKKIINLESGTTSYYWDEEEERILASNQ